MAQALHSFTTWFATFPWRILIAGVLLALHHAFGMSLEWSSGSGSQNLTGTAADGVAVLQGVGQVVALGRVDEVIANTPWLERRPQNVPRSPSRRRPTPESGGDSTMQ